MPQAPRIILVEPEAPPKPPAGAPCNGCGVCCLIEPCPLGVLISKRRRGTCEALQWQAETAQYRCGAIIAPRAMLAQQLPVALAGLRAPLAWVLQRAARRWVAAGSGCDCEVDTSAGPASDVQVTSKPL